jgi:hypothetical protein
MFCKTGDDLNGEVACQPNARHIAARKAPSYTPSVTGRGKLRTPRRTKERTAKTSNAEPKVNGKPKPEHDCDRYGPSTKVIDETGGEPIPVIYASCSVCGKPQVFPLTR